MDATTKLTVNGRLVEVETDPGTSLLLVLRHELGLLGVRPGCNSGFCGSCTVLVGDAAIRSCDTPLGEVADRAITTPEGLGTPERPGPVQEAFLSEQAAQCGFCINGIIVATESARRRGEPPTTRGAPTWLDDEHLCRCGTHVRILAAIRRALVADDGERLAPCTRSVGVEADPSAGTDHVHDLGSDPPDATRTSAWLRLLEDGRIAVLTGRVEFGQGIREALATVVAAQLGLHGDRIVVWSVTTGVNADERYTAGSNSVDTGGAALARAAVAFAREIKVRAGAVLAEDPDQVAIEPDGMIRAGTRSVSLAELSQAGPVDVPILADDRPDWSQRAPDPASIRADLVPKLTGAPAYLHDLRLPGMLYARVVLPPTYEAALVELDPEPARALDGVVHVLVSDRLLLVIADREDAAERAVARLALDARWGNGQLPTRSSRLHEYLRARPSDRFTVRDDAGLVDDPGAFRASYRVPYQAHAPIAPSCGVAEVRDGRLYVWSHTQGVYPLRETLASLLDRPEQEVVVAHRDGPGCYGHNLADDAAALAAMAAEAVPGRPVSFRFSLEDEFTWEPYGSAMSMELAGRVDASGRIVALEHRAVTDLHTRRPAGDPAALLVRWLTDPGSTWPPLRATEAAARNAEPLYAIDRLTAVADHVEGPLRTSSLRTLGAFANTFASESFVDELAVLAGRDPIAFRLDHLQDPRASEVLRAVAEHVGWESRATPTGRGTGVALARYKGQKAYVAVVAVVAVDPDAATVTVSRVTAVCDAGRIIDADGARNQLEGGIVQALSRTLHEEVHFTEAGISSRDWSSYPTLRFAATPQIEVLLLDRDEPPLGVGEASLGPTAAAVANAVDDALGVRFRDLPLTPERIRARLYALEGAELERVVLSTADVGDA